MSCGKDSNNNHYVMAIKIVCNERIIEGQAERLQRGGYVDPIMAEPSPMNSSNEMYSYAENSQIQRKGLTGIKITIKEIIAQSLDVSRSLASSSTFRIADLGCSTGPNAFFAMENIVEAVESKCLSQGLDSGNLEFQVFFCDQAANDFNTLFASLPPGRRYFAAGVPDSFYSQVLPSSSLHFAYSSYALHWLSKSPEELLIRNSPAWNAGKIHHVGAPEGVVNAYVAQFEKDLEIFLSARAKEIVPGGIVVILVVGTREGFVTGLTIAIAFLGCILMEMVQEGLLEQDEVDTFNFPNLYPSVKEMTKVVESNGSFSIEKMEIIDIPSITTRADTEGAILHLRAATEGTFAKHFGSHIAEEMFKRAVQQKEKFNDQLFDSSGVDHGANLLAILKRK